MFLCKIKNSLDIEHFICSKDGLIINAIQKVLIKRMF
jgi:hypothetical protein